MTIETKKFSRRPFDVEAVRVTKTNMDGVAEWCGGVVNDIPATETIKAERFIQVDVHAPVNERQSRAFPGDYVLLLDGGKSFKVYTTKAFNKNFVPAEDTTTKSGVTVQKHEKKPAPEAKPSNGIKPEAREALRKMGEAGQKAVEKGMQTASEIRDAVVQPDQDEKTPMSDVENDPFLNDDKDETPSAAVEIPLSEADQQGLNDAAEAADRSNTPAEAELQVVNQPVEGTTEPKLEVVQPPAEPERKRKFVQQPEVIDGNG